MTRCFQCNRSVTPAASEATRVFGCPPMCGRCLVLRYGDDWPKRLGKKLSWSEASEARKRDAAARAQRRSDLRSTNKGDAREGDQR